MVLNGDDMTEYTMDVRRRCLVFFLCFVGRYMEGSKRQKCKQGSKTKEANKPKEPLGGYAVIYRVLILVAVFGFVSPLLGLAIFILYLGGYVMKYGLVFWIWRTILDFWI